MAIPHSSRPWAAPRFTKRTIHALKGLASGTADAGQQALAINWIVNDLCGSGGMPFIPDSARETDFALGKLFVGQQISKLLEHDFDVLMGLPSAIKEK